MSKRRYARNVISAFEEESKSNDSATNPRNRSLLILGTSSFLLLLALGVFANNGWFPSTDRLTGAKTGWFGNQLPKNASSVWNPLAGPSPTPIPQLAKEYIYAGSRLLTVEDAKANAAPPADLAVWRPSDGGWWVMGGQGSLQVMQNWGSSGDEPVAGDYDGDGKTDFAVFRPSNGNWYMIYSSDSTTSQFPFGQSGDIAAQGDYDGDGKTDSALFRGSNGTWYIQKSASATIHQQQFGLSTDEVAPADYDGDGLDDIGVWRNSTKVFYSLNSSNGVLQTPGMPQFADKVVSSDYDGDGKADYAIRYGAAWIIRKSSDLSTYSFTPDGDLASDRPVENDYDGDGKTDIAVWRNSNGNWYIRQSGTANSLRQVQWGIPGDIPIPALYRR